MPTVTGDTPKYLCDVWVVEEVDRLGRHDSNLLLGVFDTLTGAQEFSNNVGYDPHYEISVSKIAYYTTKWSNTNEE